MNLRKNSPAALAFTLLAIHPIVHAEPTKTEPQPSGVTGTLNTQSAPSAPGSATGPAAEQSGTPIKKRQGGGPENPERPFRPASPPVVSGKESLKNFKLPPGFKIEVVACEPMIETPVAVSWDHKGRMYVVEMNSYMHDMDGNGEDQPVGRIKLLEDLDGDGIYDKASVFVDKQIMPRAVMALGDGALVVTPPTLTFYRDTDGDGVADSAELVDDEVGKLGGQPEYLPNSPLWGLDNWITFSLHTVRYRYQQGSFSSGPGGKSGQWGRSQDDWGRHYFNYNSDLLRCDLIPPLWYSRNPRITERSAINVQTIKDQTVWPGHPNPGINRGYNVDALRPDGTQKLATATCGAGIYRGNLFPKEYRGNAFVPEPAGNLVKRLVLEDGNTTITAKNAYETSEFLTSSDERFRPVNAVTGPDGALYVVDMARGIIQHKVFLSYYLAANIEERKLESPINLGRIYRIVPDKSKPKTVKLPEQPSELVGLLSHENGWVRDTAQRMLVERNDQSVAAALKDILAKGKSPQARLHALWTLEGIHALDAKTLERALKDTSSKVRAAVLTLATEATWQHAFLPGSSANENGVPFARLLNDKSPDVQLALAFQLGTRPAAESRPMLTQLLRTNPTPAIAQGVLSGLQGKELEYLEELAKLPNTDSKWLQSSGIMKLLASTIQSERKPTSITRVLDIATSLAGNPSVQTAVLEGLSGKPSDPKKAKTNTAAKPIQLASEPDSLKQLESRATPNIKPLLALISQQLSWPGKPATGPVRAPVKPLNEAEKALFEKGRAVYNTICFACHQPSGLGLPGLAPTLVGSDWVTGPADRLVRIVLQGLTGPIEVNGTKWQLEMPAVTHLSDEELAAVLTYVRREWENDGTALTPTDITATRAKISGRTTAWTASELQKPLR